MMIDRGLVPLTRPFTHEKAPVFFSTIAVGRQSRRTPWKRGLTVPRTHTFHQQCSTNLWYTSKRVHTLDHRLYKPNSTCKHTRAPALTFIQTIYIYPNTSKHHVLSILHIHIVCLRGCECVLLRGRSWQWNRGSPQPYRCLLLQPPQPLRKGGAHEEKILWPAKLG